MYTHTHAHTHTHTHTAIPQALTHWHTNPLSPHQKIIHTQLVVASHASTYVQYMYIPTSTHWVRTPCRKFQRHSVTVNNSFHNGRKGGGLRCPDSNHHPSKPTLAYFEQLLKMGVLYISQKPWIRFPAVPLPLLSPCRSKVYGQCGPDCVLD